VIRRKLDSGALPVMAPDRLEVNRGSGEPCNACGDRIRAVHIEHEFNYTNEQPPLRLHFDCAAEWMALRRERREQGLDRAS
jgi:hypothetical protein